MTTEQKKAIQNAELAYIAAMDAGVSEDFLIDRVFDASNEWKAKQLKSQKKTVSN